MRPEDDDKEDDDDQDHQMEFIEKQLESGETLSVPNPARVTEATEKVTAGVVAVPALEQLLADVGREPPPSVPRRAPAIAAPAVPVKAPAVEVPSKVGIASSAQVADAIGITQGYQLELEAAGWTEQMAVLAQVSQQQKFAQKSSQTGLSAALIGSILVAGAAERFYTKYVSGSYKNSPGFRERERVREERAARNTRSSRSRQSSLSGEGINEARARGGAQRIRRRRVERSAQRETAKEVNRGMVEAIKKFRRGGRGGFHTPVHIGTRDPRNPFDF